MPPHNAFLKNDSSEVNSARAVLRAVLRRMVGPEAAVGSVPTLTCSCCSL